MDDYDRTTNKRVQEFCSLDTKISDKNLIYLLLLSQQATSCFEEQAPALQEKAI